MPNHVIVPPPCIEGGEPPCPICPVRFDCAWWDKIRISDADKRPFRRKSALYRRDIHSDE